MVEEDRRGKTDALPSLVLRGVKVWRDYLNRDAQERLVQVTRNIIQEAPLFRPVTRRGQPLSVRMSSAGAVGWISDQAGYRYERRHPNGVEWPGIPEPIKEIWNALSGDDAQPDTCLVNFYEANAKMGLHQDKDEADFSHPVLSVSLGDDALFRIGNETRGGKTDSVWLHSGDVLLMGGEARLLHHGIDRLRPGSSNLLPYGGRINLTLRVARATTSTGSN